MHQGIDDECGVFGFIIRDNVYYLVGFVAGERSTAAQYGQFLVGGDNMLFDVKANAPQRAFCKMGKTRFSQGVAVGNGMMISLCLHALIPQ